MSVKIKCTCGKQFGVMERHVGKKGRCPHCGALMVLQPADGSAPASKPAKGSTPAPAESKKPEAKKPANGAAPAPVEAKKSSKDSAPAPGETKKPTKDAAPPRPSAIDLAAAAVARKEIDLDSVVSMRSGAIPVKEGGRLDADSQKAAIRHLVNRCCPTCGARYNEGAARCPNCHAPLSEEEIAAAKAAKKPPLIPWLPNFYLSPGAKKVAILLGVALVGLIIYAFMYPSLQRKARLQAEFTLIEKHLTAPAKGVSEVLLYLTLEMPGYPWNRPDSVQALGKWERRAGAGVFMMAGKGTYDLARRELVVTAAEGVQYRTVAPPVLHLAARAGDISFVRKLLKEPGIDINQTDSHGATALHYAAGAPGDQVDIVKLLLDRGANNQLTDDKGLTPIATARARGNSKVVKALGGGVALEPAV